MQVRLYTNNSESNALNKDIQLVTELLDTHPVDGLDVENPIIKVGSYPQHLMLSLVNYAWIPDLNRYYFVDPPTLINNQTLVLPMRVDVLMSFKNSIKSLTAIVSRQENQYNLYLPDPEFKVYANTDKKTLKFSRSPFTKSANFLLTVSGGT